MRASLLAILFCLCPQDDPFKTLIDPAKRAKDEDRKAALEAFRARSRDSATHYVAARFLQKSDRQWRLVYDRLKTPTGAMAGTVEGASFVPFAGGRVPVSSGTLERDLRDPAAVELDAFLAKFWAAPPTTEQQHRDALAALLQAADRTARTEAGPEVFRLFALAHLSALGDRGADAAGKMGFSKDGDRWGRRDDLVLYAIAKGFAKPAYIPLEAEKAARSSPQFGPRYVVALLDIQKAFFANSGFEALWKALPGVAGPNASKAATEHLKALADAVKVAASCANCKDGKVPCDQCQGKKRCDVTCPTCHGLGWSQKGDKANILIQCVNCRGATVFKNAACPTCKQAGVLECVICSGKGWRDGFKGCKDCKPCAACKGRRQTETPCATCGGKGRTGPLVAGIPTILCADCKGNAILKGPCKSCAQTGLADCSTCGGKGPRDGKSPARPKAADVYSSDACSSCGGAGWPLPNLAVPCDKCFGLAIRVKPMLDPTRVLE